MRAILEFDLPDDAAEHKLALDGGKWFSAAWDFDQWLRGAIKYGEKEPTAQEIRDKLYEILRGAGVRFDD